MRILKEWKKQQKLDYLKLKYNTMQPEQLVFSNETNDLIQPKKSRKWLLHVVEKYKLHKITPHGLRHIHCSLLFEAGTTLKEVQDRLGHSDAQTTMNIYAHVSQKVRDGAIQKFENFLNM